MQWRHNKACKDFIRRMEIMHERREQEAAARLEEREGLKKMAEERVAEYGKQLDKEPSALDDPEGQPYLHSPGRGHWAASWSARHATANVVQKRTMSNLNYHFCHHVTLPDDHLSEAFVNGVGGSIGMSSGPLRVSQTGPRVDGAVPGDIPGVLSPVGVGSSFSAGQLKTGRSTGLRAATTPHPSPIQAH